MASSMLFRGNLYGKCPNKYIGVNLNKNAILTYFGLFSSGPPWEPALQKIFFLLEILKYDPLRKYVLF